MSQGKDTSFLGVHIPRELYHRLYRAKAGIELSTGKFYGMGRLVERAIRRGLSQLEREMGQSPEDTSDSKEN